MFPPSLTTSGVVASKFLFCDYLLSYTSVPDKLVVDYHPHKTIGDWTSLTCHIHTHTHIHIIVQIHTQSKTKIHKLKNKQRKSNIHLHYDVRHNHKINYF